MALRLVRQTSDIPNIANTDDAVMTRYAYGGYNGVVKAFGNECNYDSAGGMFKILDGRIVIDGWEIDIDGAGTILSFSSIISAQYHSVYAEINVATESVKIDSVYLTGSYPTIDKGDDLTNALQGTARILLYNIKAENGKITEIIKRFEVIPYLAQKVLDTEKKLQEITGENKPLYQYDETKGTIEQRLTRLGFRWGAISFAGGSYGSQDNIDTASNGVFRQGNYVVGNLNTQLKFSSPSTVLSTYFVKGKTLFQIPKDFTPNRTIKVYVGVEVQGFPNYNTTFYVSLDDTGKAVVEKSFVSDWDGKTLDISINFGYEALPIGE